MSKTVVVMSGGGAKGCFQVGVLKYLEEQGEKFHALYGTSVGALNAAGYVTNGAAGTEAIWRSIKGKSDILSFNWSVIPMAPFLMFGWGPKGIYSTEPLRKLLNKHACGPAAFAKGYACKVSLKTGKIAYGNTDEADWLDSVESSAAIPGIMEPIKNEWVDGGVREMTPLKQAFIDHPDVERIIVIMCSPYVEDPDAETFEVSNWFKNAFRALDVLEHEVYINDVQVCITKNNDPRYRKVQLELYCPDTVFMDTLDFTPAKLAAGIDMGYEMAKKGPKIRA